MGVFAKSFCHSYLCKYRNVDWSASIGMLIGIVIGTVIDYEKTSKEIDKIDDSLKGKS